MKAQTSTGLVEEFHRIFGHPIGAAPTEELLDFRLDLLIDEVAELEDEVYLFRDTGVLSPNFIKELADVQYVLSGFAVALGIDLDLATALVHASNLTKLGPNGEVLRRDDGKILKGPNYEEPDLTALLPKH